MSQAFVKENDEQWLHDVQPTINALIVYLTRENNGIRVYEVSTRIDSTKNSEIYKMSNSLEYAKDSDGRWEIVWSTSLDFFQPVYSKIHISREF